jgi:hypothetical protein
MVEDDVDRKLEGVTGNPGPGRLFWLVATVYALVVLLTLALTTAGLRRDGLAALPAMTLTLPTSLALTMLMGPIAATRVVSVFIAEIVASATINIGIAYFIARWRAGRREKSAELSR